MFLLLTNINKFEKILKSHISSITKKSRLLKKNIIEKSQILILQNLNQQNYSFRHNHNFQNKKRLSSI